MKEKSITNQTGRSSRFGKLNKHDSQNHKLYIEPELLDDIQESIIMLDSEFKLVLANKQAEPLLPINTLPGAVIPLFKEWLPLEKNKYSEAINHIRSGQIWQGDLPIQVDGQQRYFRHRIYPRQDGETFNLFLIISDDITELLNAQEKAEIAIWPKINSWPI
ncbi:hypothetical protein [Syntrophomonas palmitatica]|uniref:hypothetical protein n=1 Tax=Syntrophomonas palmitatica TaxID=402877 RepID=UPI0006D081ED|nr:hypothetical protein [Syntrophomonas palmitatica]